jgi:hypothetical protein
VRNAVKAQIIVLVNATMVLAVAFGAPLDDRKQTAVALFVNAALSTWVLVTDKGAAPAPPA